MPNPGMGPLTSLPKDDEVSCERLPRSAIRILTLTELNFSHLTKTVLGESKKKNFERLLLPQYLLNDILLCQI